MAKNLRTMLKEQIQKSASFENTHKKNVAEDFEEVCKDILRSDSVSACFLQQINAVGAHVPGIAIASAQYTGEPADVQNIIWKNLPAFMVPLAMFYWGMQIGKKLAGEESKQADASKSLEDWLKSTDSQDTSNKTAWQIELNEALKKIAKKPNGDNGEGEIQDIEGNQI